MPLLALGSLADQTYRYTVTRLQKEGYEVAHIDYPGLLRGLTASLDFDDALGSTIVVPEQAPIRFAQFDSVFIRTVPARFADSKLQSDYQRAEYALGEFLSFSGLRVMNPPVAAGANCPEGRPPGSCSQHSYSQDLRTFSWTSALVGDPLIKLNGSTQHCPKIGYLEQSQASYSTDQRAIDFFRDGVIVTEDEARTILNWYGFTPFQPFQPLGMLSPGERARLVIAKLVFGGADLIILDEPTNHLDIEGLKQLEAALIDFEGALIVVSHDRRFLDNIGFNTELRVVGDRIAAATHGLMARESDSIPIL